MSENDRISHGQAQIRMPQWRILAGRAHLTVQCETFGKAMAFVNAVADLAKAARHHPDVDIRFSRVHLTLASHDVGGMSERDVALGEQIVEAATDQGLTLQPHDATWTQIAIDTTDPARIMPFWQAIYGYEQADDTTLVDPARSGPDLWFQRTDEPSLGGRGRNRIHIDLYIPHDQIEARLEAAQAAGGTLVSAHYAPSWWVLADADGNEACLCTWQAPPED